MKTIIAGSRTFTNYVTLLAAIEEAESHGIDITEVVSGGAQGVDALGSRYSLQNHLSLTVFPADWENHGLAAGPIRNRKMAEYADALIALWDGKSKGTKNMIDEATKRGLTVYVHSI